MDCRRCGERRGEDGGEARPAHHSPGQWSEAVAGRRTGGQNSPHTVRRILRKCSSHSTRRITFPQVRRHLRHHPTSPVEAGSHPGLQASPFASTGLTCVVHRDGPPGMVSLRGRTRSVLRHRWSRPALQRVLHEVCACVLAAGERTAEAQQAGQAGAEKSSNDSPSTGRRARTKSSNDSPVNGQPPPLSRIARLSAHGRLPSPCCPLDNPFTRATRHRLSRLCGPALRCLINRVRGSAPSSHPTWTLWRRCTCQPRERGPGSERGRDDVWGSRHDELTTTNNEPCGLSDMAMSGKGSVVAILPRPGHTEKGLPTVLANGR